MTATYIFATTNSQGRKSNALRQFYDLSAQGFAYNSFEIAFRLPTAVEMQQVSLDDASTLESDFAEIGKQLQQAIEWSLSPNDSANNVAPVIELLEALDKLVPPLTGMVKSIEV